MPQILRYPDDTISVTVDASNARYPTAVVLPRGTAEVGIAPTTNVGRFAWDVNEGADATVASTFPVSAGAALYRPVPRSQQDWQRHVMTLKVSTALADGEKFTISDGTNSLVLESDAGNDNVAVGSTEIGTNASTAATQATGIAAAILAWGSGAYIRAEVDAENTATVVLMAHTAAKRITITHSGTAVTTGDGVTTIDLGTGILTVTDYGLDRPILYVLSATTSTVISIDAVGE
jgi:hypothetical protein